MVKATFVFYALIAVSIDESKDLIKKSLISTEQSTSILQWVKYIYVFMKLVRGGYGVVAL